MGPVSIADPAKIILSIIVMTNGAEPRYLAETIESLLWQTSRNWQCIVCSVATEKAAKGKSLSRLVRIARHDGRIIYLPGLAAKRGAALQAAVRRASGEFVLVLDAGDLLAKDAIILMARQIRKYPDSIVIYADEVCRGGGGEIAQQAKPEWSPDRLPDCYYFGRPTALRRNALLDAGGYAEDLEIAAEWDMALRLTLPLADKVHTQEIRLVPKVLCHRLTLEDCLLPSEAWASQSRSVITRHWSRLGIEASVKTSPAGVQCSTWPMHRSPLISVVIADRYDAQSLRATYRCVTDSVGQMMIEIIVIDHGSQAPGADDLAEFLKLSEAVIIESAPDESYYSSCNRAAAVAQGELLLFLRVGVEFHTADWFAELVRHATRPGVGMVAPRFEPTFPGEPVATANPKYLSGACHIIRRKVFDRVGRYDERFKECYGDIGLSLTVASFGYRNVRLGQSASWHGGSRGTKREAHDAALMALTMNAFGVAVDPTSDARFLGTAMIHDREGRPQMAVAPQRPEIPDLNSDRSIIDSTKGWAEHVILGGDGDMPIGNISSAARLIITLLRRCHSLRGRFPTALSDGVNGAFARWLAESESLGLDADEKAKVRAAFEAGLSKKGRQVAFYSGELKAAEPLFLLPDGRFRLVAALFAAFDSKVLTLEEVWWTLIQSSESVGAELIQTWLYTPDWQTKFPNGLNAAEKTEVSRWVRDRFNVDAKFFEHLTWPIPSETAIAHPDYKTREDGRAAAASFKKGVNVLAHFSYPSGLRASAEALVDSLKSCDVAVSLRNVPVNLAWDEPEFERYSGLECHDVSIIHVQPEPYFVDVFARAGLRERSPMTYRVGYWYWESADVPEAWDAAASRCDELWTATAFVSAALESRYAKPVRILPPGVQIPDFNQRPRSYFDLPEGTFVFLFVFHMTSEIERKNPLGLIAAFRAAFNPRDNVLLVIKTTYGRDRPSQLASLRSAAAGFPIRIVDDVYDRDQMLSLMASCDSYISLHRSEGLGLTMIEAMLLGKPTIATGYSGNTDFMTNSNSLLVDYEIVTLEEDLPNYRRGLRWAQPSIDHAIVQMRHVFDNRDAARDLGLRGQAELRATMSLRQAGTAMVRRLAEL